MNYDTWKTTEPEHEGGGAGRLAVERAWWHGFNAAKRDGRALDYLAEYDGLLMYAVLVEDARRVLESEAALVELDVMAGEHG